MNTRGKGWIVWVGNVDLHFLEIDDLEARIAEEQTRLIRMSKNIMGNSYDPSAWKSIRLQASYVRDLLVGLSKWLDHEDRSIDALIREFSNKVAGEG